MARLLCLAVALLGGPHPSRALTLRDQTGRNVTVGAAASRVVSLAPNMTEMLYAIGVEPVGVTMFCNYPEAARTRSKVGGMDPDYEAIAGLRPDLIVATTAGNRADAIDFLRSLGHAIYTSDPRSIRAITEALLDIGRLTGREAAARNVSSRILQEVASVEKLGGLSPAPRVLCLIWPDPIVAVGGGTFVHEVIEKAGGHSVSRDYTQSWPVLDRESFLVLRPDLILVAAPPDRMKRELLPASLLGLTRTTPIYFIHEDLLLRPGPRVGESVREVSRILRANAR